MSPRGSFATTIVDDDYASEEAAAMRAAFVTFLVASIILLSFVAAGRAEPFPGNPPVTPRWAYEPWVWEDNANTQNSTQSIVDDYLGRGIPVGAVIIDSPWETHYNTFDWDTSRYPNPQTLISNMHSKGVKVVAWITGFVNTDSPDYSHVVNNGYTVNGGQVFDWWLGKGVHIDFTNPSAKAWWHDKMDKLLDIGIDGWKVDNSGNRVSDPVRTSIGTISRLDFKKYYAADFYDYTRTRAPTGVIMVRPYSVAQGGYGSSVSKCSVCWVGDHNGDFSGIATQMNDIYTSAQAGYSMVGVEVGGYKSTSLPTKRSLIRYAQFGALTPLMENGGKNGGLAQHLPWYWDSQTTDIYRYYATLHSELVPYMFSYGVDANLNGTPIIRNANKSRAHHTLGRDLFVSVLTSDVTSKSVTFPSGSKWIDYWNEDRVYAGGTTTKYSAPLDKYPLFVRAGAIIPMNVRTSVTGHGDANSRGKITLNIYPFGSTSFRFHRPTGDGTAYENITIYSDEGAKTVRVVGPVQRPYVLRVKSFTKPTSVVNADKWSYSSTGKRVIINKTGASFTVTIRGLSGYSSLAATIRKQGDVRPHRRGERIRALGAGRGKGVRDAAQTRIASRSSSGKGKADASGKSGGKGGGSTADGKRKGKTDVGKGGKGGGKGNSKGGGGSTADGRGKGGGKSR